MNKVGLTNPGIDWWTRDIGPRLDYARIAIVASIFGEAAELADMARMLNRFDHRRASRSTPPARTRDMPC